MKKDKYIELLEKIDKSFEKLNGCHLPCPPEIKDRYKWLDQDAPYSILAHNAEKDPHFIYANQYALKCFKYYTMSEILALPSRLSAGEQDQAEREKLLETVKKDGIAYNYTGPRVDKYGNTFNIYDGIVWQLTEEKGTIWGQGALFWTDQNEKPRWYTEAINKKK